jgi:hypothetical protein
MQMTKFYIMSYNFNVYNICVKFLRKENTINTATNNKIIVVIMTIIDQ